MKIKKQRQFDKRVAMDFEAFLRFKLPKLLNLSKSKTVGMRTKFLQFSNFINFSGSENLEEFERFFNEFRKRVKKVSKYRSPKGTKIGPNSDGKYILVDKYTKKRLA